MRAWLGFVWALAALSGCRKPSPSRAEPPPITVALSGSAASVLTVASEVEASGLRVRSGTLPVAGALWGFSDLELDAARTRLEIQLAKAGAPLAQLLPSGGLAVVNGGYFEADFRPSTWLENDGVELAPKSDTSKGGLLAVGQAGVFVGPFSALRFEPTLAVQSFPLLVEPDYVPGIHRDDGRRAARTVACLVGRTLHFIVIAAPRGEGPTLLEAAAALRAAPPLGFGCRVALNLDGGPSTGVWFAPQINARQRPPLANVGYAIAIFPR